MNKIALRVAFTKKIEALAREDKKIFAVASDSRGSVTLSDFARNLPEQFVECGIAEQDAIGISAGLALGGLVPFVCGPACFYSMRSAEQVKVDVAYSHQNVKIIGVSGGVSYGALGTSHHATQDIALMRAIPTIEVYLPSDAVQMEWLTEYLARSGEPAYVRVGRGAVPEIYENGKKFEVGKAIRLRKGESGAIIAAGETVFHALGAADALAKEGIAVSVYDMFSIKPFDTDAVLEAARTGLVVTVEEHCVHGGLGGAVAEILSQQAPTKMKILGFPDDNLYTGASEVLFEKYGLDALGIERTIRALL